MFFHSVYQQSTGIHVLLGRPPGSWQPKAWPPWSPQYAQGLKNPGSDQVWPRVWLFMFFGVSLIRIWGTSSPVRWGLDFMEQNHLSFSSFSSHRSSTGAGGCEDNSDEIWNLETVARFHQTYPVLFLAWKICQKHCRNACQKPIQIYTAWLPWWRSLEANYCMFLDFNFRS